MSIKSEHKVNEHMHWRGASEVSSVAGGDDATRPCLQDKLLAEWFSKVFELIR
jgi:hypothetical protein